MAAVLDPPDDLEAERSLDQLIPPPRSGVQKLFVGTLLLGSAVVLAIAMIGGWLRPQPFDSGGWGGTRALEIDEAQGLLGATTRLPNYSSRAVRLVNAELIDAPGAEVAMVEVLPDSSCGEEVVESDGSSVATCPVMFTPAGDGTPLPVMIPARGEIEIRFWFRPTRCEDGDIPWGTVEATFDFGEGAFPPFRRTDLGDDQLWDGPGESVAVFPRVGGPASPSSESLSGSGPLEVACAALEIE